jgi:hypothetical protein
MEATVLSPFQVLEQSFAEQKRFPLPKLLISGLTRGGTLFVANFFGNLGVFAAHEGIFRTGGICYPDRDHKRIPTIEVSGLSALWVELAHGKGVPIVQLVRHPVHCCASNVAFWERDKRPVSWKEITKVYLQYHTIIEKYAKAVVHLERWAAEWPQIMDLLGLPMPPPEKVEKAMKSFRGSSTASDRYKWADLPTDLQKWGEKHGYS